MTDCDQEPWVMVCGGFHKNGGMDKANWHLAHHLLETGRPVHLVGHMIDVDLMSHPLAVVYRVPRPLRSFVLGSPILDMKAVRVWRRLKKRWPRARMIANGGNCLAGDVNWSHYVNAAWKPQLDGAPLRYRLRFGLEHRRACFRERVAYRSAKLVICNSEKTRGDVFSCTGGAVADVRTIYLGNDSQYNPVTPAEREAARREMGLRADRKLAAFVGGLGYDNRKGFDVLCQAWAQLSADAGWDADLIVAGSGPSFRKWQQTIGALHLGDRIRLLGFSNNIRSVLASVDVLVSASRYEPYGLNVQEALNRGIPAITTRASGIAERFPGALSPMLIENPNEVADCIRALRYWRARSDELCHEYRVLGRHLSARSWECMAREMVDCIESVEAAGEQRAGSGRRHARPANTGSDCA